MREEDDEPLGGAPHVAVVVPAYNAAATLRSSLASIVGQTYPHRSIIVMDDASTDATPAMVAALGAEIQYVRQAVNRGQFANVNDGIARAQGDLVAVLHADDEYHPTLLERAVATFATWPAAAAVFCLDELMDARGRVYERVRLSSDIPPNRPLDFAAVLNGLLRHKNRFLRTPGAVVRRAAYVAAGPYRDDYGSAGDLDMWLRVARVGPLVILDEHLFRYRHLPTSVAGAYQRLRTEPENFFRLLDETLESGGRRLASRSALRAYEAHRAEDRLRTAVNAYIVGDRPALRRALAAVRGARLWGGGGVQAGRLTVLLGVLRVLGRLPTLRPVAALFRRRWHPVEPVAS